MMQEASPEAVMSPETKNLFLPRVLFALPQESQAVLIRAVAEDYAEKNGISMLNEFVDTRDLAEAFRGYIHSSRQDNQTAEEPKNLQDALVRFFDDEIRLHGGEFRKPQDLSDVEQDLEVDGPRFSMHPTTPSLAPFK